MTGDNKIERPGELPRWSGLRWDAVYELLIRNTSTGLVRVDGCTAKPSIRPRCSPGRTLRALEGTLSEKMAVSAAAATQNLPHPPVPGHRVPDSTALESLAGYLYLKGTPTA